jgi:hypothetical protein
MRNCETCGLPTEADWSMIFGITHHGVTCLACAREYGSIPQAKLEKQQQAASKEESLSSLIRRSLLAGTPLKEVMKAAEAHSKYHGEPERARSYVKTYQKYMVKQGMLKENEDVGETLAAVAQAHDDAGVVPGPTEALV